MVTEWVMIPHRYPNSKTFAGCSVSYEPAPSNLKWSGPASQETVGAVVMRSTHFDKKICDKITPGALHLLLLKTEDWLF